LHSDKDYRFHRLCPKIHHRIPREYLKKGSSTWNKVGNPVSSAIKIVLTRPLFPSPSSKHRTNKSDAPGASTEVTHMACAGTERHGSKCWTGWADRIPAERWSIYRSVMETAKARNIPFALGGAFATATHTERWRDTNDMDLYTLPENHEEMQHVIEGLRLKDIYAQFPYHRDWTYRAADGSTIVEVIWTMRNHRADVDREWLTRWGEIEARGIKFFVAPPEEMMWAKLYVLHRLRSDWPDVLHYISVCGPGLDWQHLYDRLGPAFPLLGGALCVFSWLSPQKAAALPAWIWEKFGVRRPAPPSTDESEETRATLLSDRQNELARAK